MANIGYRRGLKRRPPTIQTFRSDALAQRSLLIGADRFDILSLARGIGPRRTALRAIGAAGVVGLVGRFAPSSGEAKRTKKP
jgi:hypothetical protein